MTHAQIRQTIAAPRAEVWTRLTDHREFARWSGLREVVLAREGYPEPDGVGAIRVVRDSGLAVEEEIVEFEPPKRLAYRMLSGAPIRNHRGEIRLEGATEVIWDIHFESRIPGAGWLIRRLLERQLGQVLRRLAADFESPPVDVR